MWLATSVISIAPVVEPASVIPIASPRRASNQLATMKDAGRTAAPPMPRPMRPNAASIGG